jgi:hemolysin activation/secretion protein
LRRSASRTCRHNAAGARRPGSAFLTLLGAGFLFAPVAALAQAPPAVPRAPTREEVEQPRPRSPGQPTRLTVEGGGEHAPCPLADPAYRDIAFTLSEVRFDNLRGLSAEDLKPAWAELAGTRQPVAAICEIRDRAATMLRDAGYIAAIEIPEQRIADGIVRFDVLMAKLVAVQVRGEAGRSERTIARYLEKLKGREVFNRREAERYLLLAGDLPGFEVRLALKSAGGARGEVIGEVSVRRMPAQLDFNVQDYGSSALGRWGGLVRGQAFGLTGLGDRTSIAFYTTTDLHEQRTLQIGHDFRVGGEGLTFGGQLTYAWANPDLGQAALDVTARTLLATALATYPFVRTQRKSLWGTLGFDLVDQKVRFNGLPLSRDKLRVAFARIELEASDPRSIGRVGGYSPAEPRWRLGATLEARQGLGLLGASHGCLPALTACTAPGAVPPSRFEGDPTATVFRLEALGEVRPVPKIAFTVGLRAQHSGRPLLAFEEFAAGNYTIGRGYDAGTLLGDSGIGFQSEIRFGSLVPGSRRGIAVQPYAFFDAAWVSNKDRLFAFTGPERLASVGGGLRASFADRAKLDIGLAVPLRRAGLLTERPDPRLLVSLITRLWPWSFK